MVDLSKIIQGKKLSETEKGILEYMVENIDTVLDKGVRTVASENYTSPATVMRLTKKLGYNGFIDLYYHLEPLVRGTVSVSEPKAMTEIHQQREIEQFIQLLENLDGKYVFIYATGFSAIIGEYMYKKLLVNGKRVLFASGSDSVGIFESNREMAGIFLTITKSGETAQVIEKMQYFKQHEIPLVTFTNEINNSASQLADIAFQIPDSQKLDDRNMRGNYFFAHVLSMFEKIMIHYQQNSE